MEFFPFITFLCSVNHKPELSYFSDNYYCLNGGTCTEVLESYDPKGYICVCYDEFFYGEFCELEYKDCRPGMCHYNLLAYNVSVRQCL